MKYKTRSGSRRRAPVFNQLPIVKARIRYIVGIDPDTEKSGLAIYDCQEKTWLEKKTYASLALETIVKNLPAADTRVYVEAGWHNKGLHKKYSENPPKDWTIWPLANKLAWMFERGCDVGENFRTGKHFVERFRAFGFEVIEYKPTTGKWDAETLAHVTGITERTNPEVRDAIKIVFFNI